MKTRHLIVTGCMFMGIGVGMIIDQLAAGTLIGMGIGYVLSSIVKKQ